MHKLFLGSIAAYFAMSLATGLAHAEAEKTTPAVNTHTLLPEVEQILFHPNFPTLEELKLNAYSGIFAITMPEGADYINVGAQTIHHNLMRSQKALAARDHLIDVLIDHPYRYAQDKKTLFLNKDINGERYYYACANLTTPNCVAQTIAQKDDINQLIQSNALLLERYQSLQKLPYAKGIYITDVMLIPMFGLPLSSLQLPQVVLAFDAGDINTGFQLLGHQIQFDKKTLIQSEDTLYQMLALEQLYHAYHTLDSLLDLPQMQAYLNDPRLLALLTPLNKEEQTALTVSFKGHERYFMLYTFYTTASPEKTNAWHSNKKRTLLDASIQDTIDQLIYDPIETTNIAYLFFEARAQRAELTIDEASALYLKGELEPFEKIQQRIFSEQIENAKQQGRESNNPLGRKELGIAAWEDYTTRLYDLQSYIMLVNMKHQIIRNNIKADEINAFLQAAGTAAQNPITRETFTWNAKEGTLSTPWFSQNLPYYGSPYKPDAELKKLMPRNTVYIQR